MSSAPSGFQAPKTNWQPSDPIGVSDLNRIEANINAIETGARTLDPTQAPTGNVGGLRQILDWLANRIKAITGATNWYDAPVKSIAQLNSDLAAHTSRTDNPHQVTAAQVGAPPTTRRINTTAPLQGGGDLSADRTLSIASGGITSGLLATGAVTAGKIADGGVDTINRIASGIRTSTGGTEANRLAVTDENGRVGAAKVADLFDGRGSAAASWWVVPGNTVAASSLAESYRESTRAFLATRPGRYRVSFEAKADSGGFSASVAVYVVGIRYGAGVSPAVETKQVGSFSTTSDTYVVGTIDMNIPVPAGAMIVVYQSSLSGYMRNVYLKYDEAAAADGFYTLF